MQRSTNNEALSSEMRQLPLSAIIFLSEFIFEKFLRLNTDFFNKGETFSDLLRIHLILFALLKEIVDA